MDGTFVTQFPSPIMAPLANLYRANEAGVREKFLTQHLAIGEAVLSGDPGRAETVAGGHIGFVIDTVVGNPERRCAPRYVAA